MHTHFGQAIQRVKLGFTTNRRRGGITGHGNGVDKGLQATGDRTDEPGATRPGNATSNAARQTDIKDGFGDGFENGFVADSGQERGGLVGGFLRVGERICGGFSRGAVFA